MALLVAFMSLLGFLQGLRVPPTACWRFLLAEGLPPGALDSPLSLSRSPSHTRDPAFVQGEFGGLLQPAWALCVSWRCLCCEVCMFEGWVGGKQGSNPYHRAAVPKSRPRRHTRGCSGHPCLGGFSSYQTAVHQLLVVGQSPHLPFPGPAHHLHLLGLQCVCPLPPHLLATALVSAARLRSFLQNTPRTLITFMLGKFKCSFP